MKSFGNISSNLLYELQHAGDDDYLRNHPGDAFDVLASARVRLRSHPRLTELTPAEFEEVAATLKNAYDKAQTLCESPIEREMLAALMAGCWSACANPFIPVHDARDKSLPFPRSPIVIVPQFAIARYRLDFAIVCRGETRHHILAVECDGAEFHDACKDSERDDYLRALGLRIYRFSGKHISSSATELADIVIAAAGQLI